MDNVLWKGWVIDEKPRDEETRVLKELNERIFKDEDVELAMLGIADGLTLVSLRN